MDFTTPKKNRLDLLKAKLAAREGKKEYAESCKATRAEIETLEKEVK